MGQEHLAVPTYLPDGREDIYSSYHVFSSSTLPHLGRLTAYLHEEECSWQQQPGLSRQAEKEASLSLQLSSHAMATTLTLIIKTSHHIIHTCLPGLPTHLAKPSLLLPTLSTHFPHFAFPFQFDSGRRREEPPKPLHLLYLFHFLSSWHGMPPSCTLGRWRDGGGGEAGGAGSGGGVVVGGGSGGAGTFMVLSLILFYLLSLLLPHPIPTCLMKIIQ